MIKDTDDIFFYPQRVSDYNRLVTFDLGSSSSSGSGGIIFGNESIVLGAFSHRSDFFGATRNAFSSIGDASGGGTGMPTSPLVSSPLVGPFQWFDVIFGWQGGDNPWGARLSVGRNEQDVPGASEATANVTSVNVVIGFTVNDIDLSGEFSIADAEAKDGGTPGTTTSETPLGFAVSARKTATEESDDLQLGWLGAFSFATAGPEETGATTSNQDDSEVAFAFGAGPVYTPHERTTVAMYGTFELERMKSEVGTSSTTTNSYVIPGWHIAAEVELSSWLQARAGLVSRFAINNVKMEAPGGDVEDQNTSLNFDWHTGVGIVFDDFAIDGYIHPDVITSGTDLLGDSSDMFGLVTASYSF